MLLTGLCNIGHCALTPISRSDITRVFSFGNYQKNILRCSLSRNRRNQNWFFSKAAPLIFGFLGIYNRRYASTLPSLCLRSGFALPSLLWVEAKWIQNGMKKTSTLPMSWTSFPFVLPSFCLRSYERTQRGFARGLQRRQNVLSVCGKMFVCRGLLQRYSATVRFTLIDASKTNCSTVATVAYRWGKCHLRGFLLIRN